MTKQGNLDRLKAVFDSCDVNARGGVFKQTTLALDLCPDDLARWLVERGADLSAGDSYGDTPLHAGARRWRGRMGVLIDSVRTCRRDRAVAGRRCTVRRMPAIWKMWGSSRPPALGSMR